MWRMAMESVPSSPVTTAGSLKSPPTPRIAALGLVDDGRAELLSEDAGVGDGEGAGADFVGLELLGAGALGEIGDGAGDAEEALFFGVLDDGNDESPVERDGDADVDVLAVADGVAFHLRVDDGHLAQGGDDGAGDERHVGELDAVALLIFVFFFFPDFDDAREVDLEDGVHVRGGAFGVDHALRDDGAHLAHGNQLAGLRDGSGWSRGLGGGGCRCGCWRCRNWSGCWSGRGFGGSRLLHVGEDVFLGDASAGAGSGDLGEVEVVVLGDLADERRGAEVLGGCGGRFGDRSAVGLGGRLWCRCRGDWSSGSGGGSSGCASGRTVIGDDGIDLDGGAGLRP